MRDEYVQGSTPLPILCELNNNIGREAEACKFINIRFAAVLTFDLN